MVLDQRPEKTTIVDNDILGGGDSEELENTFKKSKWWKFSTIRTKLATLFFSLSNLITAWGTPTDAQVASAKLVNDTLSGKLGTSAQAYDSARLGNQLPAYYQAALGFTAENVSNKVTSVSSASTDTQYATAAALWKMLPPGVVLPYGGSSAPTGFVMADGASYLRSGTYADLFAIFGTNFGNVDGTHFNVPDMRGVYPKGAGTTSRAAGKDAKGNFYAGTLGVYSQDRLQGHTHLQAVDGGGAAIQGYNIASYSNSIPVNLNTGGGPVDDGTNGTPRTGLTTEPQSLGLNFIIKY
jgi:microcystin-dependent protein